MCEKYVQKKQGCTHTYCRDRSCYLAWTVNNNPEVLIDLVNQERFKGCRNLRKFGPLYIICNKKLVIYRFTMNLPFQ